MHEPSIETPLNDESRFVRPHTTNDGRRVPLCPENDPRRPVVELAAFQTTGIATLPDVAMLVPDATTGAVLRLDLSIRELDETVRMFTRNLRHRDLDAQATLLSIRVAMRVVWVLLALVLAAGIAAFSVVIELSGVE